MVLACHCDGAVPEAIQSASFGLLRRLNFFDVDGRRMNAA